MTLFVESLKARDAEKLYQFEMGNRLYFEEMVPTRGDDYYQPAKFKIRHHALLEEQAEGTSYFYLIKDEKEAILGRINLVDLNQQDKIAYLGYRVGQQHVGKGVAKKALKLLLQRINQLELKEIKAKTTNNNIASQKVLEQNGFSCEGSTDEEFEMNSQLLKFVHYSWKCE